jgi:type IV secretory pathway TrbF-like protein
LISRTLIDKGAVHVLEYLKNKHPFDRIPKNKPAVADFEEEVEESQQE